MRDEQKSLIDKIDYTKLPKHIAIIMDGNGRWAKQKHRPRLYGHRAGVKTVKKIVEIAGELNVSHLSLYAFSTENWNRPSSEITGLFKLFWEYLKIEIDELDRKNVILKILGSMDRVNPEFLKNVHQVSSKTWSNTGLHLNVLFNYGGRQEIIEAVRKIGKLVSERKLKPEEINQDSLSDYLYTSDMPDPDLVIRTSGELRLSNFMIWQTAYSEIYITDTLWPDFDQREFVKAILDYQSRNRRFGGTSE